MVLAVPHLAETAKRLTACYPTLRKKREEWGTPIRVIHAWVIGAGWLTQLKSMAGLNGAR